MSVRRSRPRGALFRLPAGVVRAALVVRVLDEWWSYLPAGTIEDQHLDLGLSYSQAGWLLALLTLGGLVGAPLGALADHGHRRALAAAGAALLAAGLASFAFGAPLPVLAAAAMLLGAASDLVIRPLESSLAELADADLDRLLGRQHLLTWLGDFIGPALLALGAATVIGWRGVFGLTAAAFVAYAAVLAATEFPEPGAAPDGGDRLWRAAFTLLRTPDVLRLTAAELILLPLDEAFLGFAVARLVGAGVGAAAQVLAGGLVVGGVLGAAIVARRGIDRRQTSAGAAAMLLGAFAAAAPLAAPAQAAAMALLGLGTALIWAKVHHRMLTVAPGRSATVPTIVGILSTPALFVPAAMGAAADQSSITVALSGAAALTVPLAVAVLRLGGDAVVSPAEIDARDE
ncbi:MAG: MFS transporter [Acidimicrobiales bacterium]